MSTAAETMPSHGRFAVLGNPIAHSLSPQIHSSFAEQCQHEIDYQRVLVEPGQFESVARGFFESGGAGLNVTAPCKADAFALAERPTERASDAGAANILWVDSAGDICADNVDGLGLVRDIETNLDWSVRGAKILLLGAGGAMRGILAPLIEASPTSIHVANRTVANAQSLCDLFGERVTMSFGDLATLPGDGWDLVINGLSSGWGSAQPDLPPIVPSSRALAYDMLYGKAPTPFLLQMQDAGFSRSSDGLGMLVEQAADSYERWHGVRPQTGSVIQQLRN